MSRSFCIKNSKRNQEDDLFWFCTFVLLYYKSLNINASFFIIIVNDYNKKYPLIVNGFLIYCFADAARIFPFNALPKSKKEKILIIHHDLSSFCALTTIKTITEKELFFRTLNSIIFRKRATNLCEE